MEILHACISPSVKDDSSLETSRCQSSNLSLISSFSSKDIDTTIKQQIKVKKDMIDILPYNFNTANVTTEKQSELLLKKQLK